MPAPVCPERTAWDQAVQMDMPHQGLPPGVEHRRHAQLAVQAFGIRGEGAQGRPDRLEQQGVDLLGMDLHPAVEAIRQGEDQVVVGHRQHRGLLAPAPLLGGPALAARAVAVAAGVVVGRVVAAVPAAQLQPAQGRGAAIHYMMAHPPLAGAEPMGCTVTGQTPVHEGLQ